MRNRQIRNREYRNTEGPNVRLWEEILRLYLKGTLLLDTRIFTPTRDRERGGGFVRVSLPNTSRFFVFFSTVSSMLSKRPVRVGNVSGATGDHPHAMLRMAQHGDVDVITGDWLSEMNIAWQAINKREDATAGYEVGFIEQLEESLDEIVKKGIKVVTNAGALNTPSLTRRVEQLCQERGYGGGGEVTVVVASVVGDDVSDLLRVKGKGSGDGGGLMLLPHLDHPERKLQDWELEPCCGNAYIGGHGIVAALEAGADIVICGRCTDASPVIAAAAWWHGWAEQDYDKLAGALVAGRMYLLQPMTLHVLVVDSRRLTTVKKISSSVDHMSLEPTSRDSRSSCRAWSTSHFPQRKSTRKEAVSSPRMSPLQDQ